MILIVQCYTVDVNKFEPKASILVYSIHEYQLDGICPDATMFGADAEANEEDVC